MKKKTKEWTPAFAHHRGKNLSYIEARKEIYLPLYTELVKQTEAFKALQSEIKNGKNVLLIDLDGPKLPLSTCDLESLKRELYNEKRPFGHGYALALALCEINFEKIF